jgi:hypothetical protein
MLAVVGATVVATLAIMMMAGPLEFVEARPPSRAMLRANAKKLARIAGKRKRAAPWHRALENALQALLEKQRVKYPHKVIEHTFWITYKHYRPAVHKGRRLAHWARGFRSPWKKLIGSCKKLGVLPVELARAIYKLTNSDWQPASCVDGPGQNKVKTRKQFYRWGKVLLGLGRRARRAGKNPVKVWNRAAAARLSTISGVRKLNVKRIPPSPKY